MAEEIIILFFLTKIIIYIFIYIIILPNIMRILYFLYNFSIPIPFYNIFRWNDTLKTYAIEFIYFINLYFFN